MSNEERNRHLKELKLQERKLREEGRLEEADALLGQYCNEAQHNV